MVIFLSDKRISDAIKSRYSPSKSAIEQLNESEDETLKILKQQLRNEDTPHILEEEENDDYFAHIFK